MPLADIYLYTTASHPNYLTAAAGKLFFIIENMLWASDGTEDGSIKLEHQIPNIELFGDINDKMLFISESDDLWVTDGTPAGTQFLLPEVNTDFNDFTSTIFGDKLWFFYDDGINGLELWNSDGTVNGTNMAFESESGNSTIFISGHIKPVAFNNNLFFKNRDDVNGEELWISDGTLAGTMLFKNIMIANALSSPTMLTPFGDKLYFEATGNNLWVTDGTPDETLTYIIRFQNTGSDTAFTVKVTDVLSPLLDLETFEPLAASHPCRVTILPENKLELFLKIYYCQTAPPTNPKATGLLPLA